MNHNHNHHDYPADTAGHLLITEVPTIGPKNTIAEVEKLLMEKMDNFKTINYIYVVNESEQKLLGVFSIKEIFRHSKNKPVSKIMNKKIIFAHPYTDQEHVAQLAVQNNIKAIPIIDKNKKFLGIVPSDTILYIIQKEASEDLFHLAGLKHHDNGIDDVLKLSIFKSLKHRAPWLFVGLLGGIFAAKIVWLFENTLEQNLILAAFIPLIVYMSDAVGTQMEAFIIRDLAINQKLNFLKYFFRQFYIIIILGLLSGLLLFIISLLLYRNPTIGAVLAIALFSAIISSVLTGLIIPYFFSKLKLDPANASGPIATIIQDLLSIIIYFSIATILL